MRDIAAIALQGVCWRSIPSQVRHAHSCVAAFFVRAVIESRFAERNSVRPFITTETNHLGAGQSSFSPQSHNHCCICEETRNSVGKAPFRYALIKCPLRKGMTVVVVWNEKCSRQRKGNSNPSWLIDPSGSCAQPGFLSARFSVTPRRSRNQNRLDTALS